MLGMRIACWDSSVNLASTINFLFLLFTEKLHSKAPKNSTSFPEKVKNETVI